MICDCVIARTAVQVEITDEWVQTASLNNDLYMLISPAKVVKLSREITTIAQDKFSPTASGPDVHTAVSPWSRVDFDERMPGAGTMLTQF